MLCALIMAGGKGTRFWPLSTEEKPKQFLNLIGNKTMIQMTVDRIKPIIPLERIFICTGSRYVDLVKAQLPDLPDRNIIVEPEPRNTAPCICLSALVIKRYFSSANMLVLPSDHLISNEDMFRETIEYGNVFLENNKDSLITLGIKPIRPETNYGYIRYEENSEIKKKYNILKVNSFVEKPNKDVAEKYINDGRYLWNAGMFMWNTDRILKEIKMYSKETYEALKEIEECDIDTIQKLVDENYYKTEAISIDYSVLEKAKDIYVIPSNIGWDDIGNWDAVQRYRRADHNGNVNVGDVSCFKGKNNLIL
ncbi:mannose-1-phosphate guanylyltransferase (GDP) [Clostridium sp. DSM 8431]|uniref:mannose-1-phosphate guanylyltransferase n=1 Tax=Clostridium sp. DSM 8431 TaxID=1761781 RepID=UPI0008F24A6C|nr:mannose-1-phosphate guanylyltransferase [Clostridium sp. DSM 8431]SFU86273.1 mannose-1-phosphate guanylyltransferase (GDP) [Clostridium sp. DSM 8431]